MKKYIVFFLIFSLSIFSSNQYAQLKKNGAYNSTTNKNYRININNISTIFHNDGRSDIDGDGAFWYPKGSNKSTVYESGFVWIGKIKGRISMGGSTFPSGMVPGKIGENPEDAKMYRVRRDWKTAKFESEIADNEGSYEEIKERYEYDWYNWPVGDGAPFEDIDSDGNYNPEIDIPGIPSAQQTIFFITNSTDPAKAQAFFGMSPMDVELHITIWAYDFAGPIGNMVFRKYQLYNKGNQDIDSCYLGMWSDPDVGNAGDDYVGCDTLLNLGYAYNAFPTDAVYDKNPPATGFLILQGPITEGGISDTAKSFEQYHQGKKNLELTAFSYFINVNYGHYNPCEYDLDDYNSSYLKWWGSFKGLNFCPSIPYSLPDYMGGDTTIFPLSGDPLTGIGDIDGIASQPDDRRYLMPSGPFTFKAGDKQEFIVAQIAAGNENGITNLEAVRLLKEYVSEAKKLYKRNFEMASMPSSPIISVSELDEKIILNWDDSLGIAEVLENYDRVDYKFQGYNIYQLPSFNADIKDAIRLTTFDVIDGVKKINQKIYDEDIGDYQKFVAQRGNDNGVQRFMVINSDSINQSKLYNGSKYYFAVSAYIYNPDPDSYQRTIESVPTRITAIPNDQSLGEVREKEFGDYVDVEKISGEGNGVVEVSVIDPESVTGNEYEISFDIDDYSNLFWKVKDKTLEEIKVQKFYNQSGNNEYPLVDGLLIKVLKNKKQGVKSAFHLNGDSVVSSKGASRFYNGGLGGSIAWRSPYGYASGNMIVKGDSLKPVLLKFAQVDFKEDYNPSFNLSDPNMSFGYRYILHPTFKYKDEFTENIKNAKVHYDFEDFEKSIPLSAWDISDPNNPRRLALGFLETNYYDGSVDGKYWPGKAPINDYSRATKEYLFIFDEDYQESATPDLKKNLRNDPMPVMYWCSFSRVRDSVWKGTEELKILPFISNTVDDKFIFTAPKLFYNNEKAKEDSKEINVFPNPYLVYNLQESHRNESFVTFNHLPYKAILRIYDLAGKHIRTLHKEDASQFLKWDLQNEYQYQVASGIYVIYIELPEIGATKILKLAVIQKQIIPFSY